MFVQPIMSEWSWGKDINGYTGTRSFISCEETDRDATSLPEIGDSWSSDLSSLTVKAITANYINNNPNCPQKFIISYDSYSIPNPEYSDTGTNAELLPISIDISYDLDTCDNTTATTKYWYWADGVADPPAVEPERMTGLATYRLNPQETFVITRYVFGDNLVDYHTIAKNSVGKVNSADWMGFIPESVRFDGAQFEEIRNDRRGSQRKWLARLKFSTKLKTGDTWNKIYDPATDERKVLLFFTAVGTAGRKQYELIDLNTLFTFGRAALSASPVVPTAVYTPIGGPVGGMT